MSQTKQDAQLIITIVEQIKSKVYKNQLKHAFEEIKAFKNEKKNEETHVKNLLV